MEYPSEQFILATHKETLRTYKNLLIVAELAAAQVEHLRELIRITESAIAQIETAAIDPRTQSTRPGEFARMTLLDSLVSYLEKVPSRRAKLREEAIPALVEAGALTSKQRKPLGSVKPNARYRVLVNLIRQFGGGRVSYDSATDTVSLA